MVNRAVRHAAPFNYNNNNACFITWLTTFLSHCCTGKWLCGSLLFCATPRVSLQKKASTSVFLWFTSLTIYGTCNYYTNYVSIYAKKKLNFVAFLKDKSEFPTKAGRKFKFSSRKGKISPIAQKKLLISRRTSCERYSYERRYFLYKFDHFYLFGNVKILFEQLFCTICILSFI